MCIFLGGNPHPLENLVRCVYPPPPRPVAEMAKISSSNFSRAPIELKNFFGPQKKSKNFWKIFEKIFFEIFGKFLKNFFQNFFQKFLTKFFKFVEGPFLLENFFPKNLQKKFRKFSKKFQRCHSFLKNLKIF